MSAARPTAPPVKWFPAVAAVVAGPPLLLAACALVVLGGALAGWHPFWREPPLSLPEAAALKDLATMQRLITNGVDVNAPGTVRAPILKSHDIVVTPLEAAVGTRTPTALQFLLARGARMDARERDVVLCLAIKDEAQELVEYLRQAGAQRPDCEHVPTPW